MVPARLATLASKLKALDESDDAEAITTLSKMTLPQMTGQIRDVEDRAMAMARDEGREEHRAKSLLQNLLHQNQPGQGAACYNAALSSQTLSSYRPTTPSSSRKRGADSSGRLSPTLESPSIHPLNIRIVPSSEIANARKRQFGAQSQTLGMASPWGAGVGPDDDGQDDEDDDDDYPD